MHTSMYHLNSGYNGSHIWLENYKVTMNSKYASISNEIIRDDHFPQALLSLCVCTYFIISFIYCLLFYHLIHMCFLQWYQSQIILEEASVYEEESRREHPLDLL